MFFEFSDQIKMRSPAEIIPLRQLRQTPTTPNPSEHFLIRDLREVLAGKDMAHEPHRHNFYFLLALEKGMGTHEIDGTSYPVRNNCVFIMRPGQVHQLTLKAGSIGYTIQFAPDFFGALDRQHRTLLRNVTGTNHYQLDAGSFQKLAGQLTHAFQEYTAKQEGYREIIQANLAIFFIELLRRGRNEKGQSRNGNLYAQQRLDEFLDLLIAHVKDCKQVSDYADMLNLSPYQLNAVTKTTLNKTASEVINDHITLEAKRYLLGSSNQVNQVAFLLGYDDASYFIRFFKKQTGYSPEAFRNNFR
ncbi:MAG TPA: helix-turn-helix transcriptional regulator [Chryseosolibacter sp.]|nr:helix-turn-helix transcriptional regulator [Chryseosolibacter sp.]